MKEYRKPRLICQISALVFVITSLVFTLLLNREMPNAEMPLTWSNSNIKLIADVSRYLLYATLVVFAYLQIAIKFSSFVQRIETLEREIEELKKR